MPNAFPLGVLFVAVLLLAVMLVQFLFLAGLFRHWLQAYLAGAPVQLVVILMMRLRRSPPRLLIETYIILRQRSFELTIADVERTYLANPDPNQEPLELAEAVARRVLQTATTVAST